MYYIFKNLSFWSVGNPDHACVCVRPFCQTFDAWHNEVKRKILRLGALRKNELSISVLRLRFTSRSKVTKLTYIQVESLIYK